MKTLKAYLQFEKMIMPFALQLMFWAGIGGTLFGSWWLYTHDNWAWIFALVFGTIGTRLIFESLIIRYKTYIKLSEISEALKNRSSE